MPLIKSAVKRMKQTAKRRQRNIGIKRDIKSATKEFLANPSAATLSKAQSELDTAVKKGLLKKAKVAKAAGVKLEKKAAKPAASTKKTPAKKPAAKTTAKKAVAKTA